MRDEAVRAKTGRGWAEWVAILDAAGAAARPHAEIARLVHSTYGVSGWWAQSVTVGYERIKGLRAIGQRREGSWETAKSKTVAVSVARLFRAFSVAKERRRWLPEPWKVRTARAGKSMRATWGDGTPVDVYFLAKGRGKSAVTIQHRKLPSGERAAELKRLWADRLEALARWLQSEGSAGRR
jgi:hypothetical protein